MDRFYKIEKMFSSFYSSNNMNFEQSPTYTCNMITGDNANRMFQVTYSNRINTFNPNYTLIGQRGLFVRDEHVLVANGNANLT